MQIIEDSRVKEKLYVEKLPNGLTVMIIPKKGIQKKYVIWGTNYGSNDSKFKGVMVGEGEETFKELAGYYVEKNPQNLKDMTGICYRDGDQIIHNGWRQIMDLSSIPFIYKDLSEELVPKR